MTKKSSKDDTAVISLGVACEQGGRPNIEDRVAAQHVATAGELQLTVGMVADGVGGSNYGERAAELAIEVVFREIEASAINDPRQIPDLLRSALEKANEAVYQEGRAEKEKRGMGSTATLAVIHNNKLYLANVGDSRAYLVRGHKGEKIKQLTQDHTWAAEMVALGRLSPADAASHPKAEELVRSIGYGSEVNVDLGLYKNGSESEEAAQQSQGFSLQADDRIVLCSDGLIKARHNDNQPYVTDIEIAQTVTRYAPEKAAPALVQAAISRRADDNVSAIVMEMPGSKRAFYMPPGALYGSIGALVLLAVVAGALVFNSRRPDFTPTLTPEIALLEQPDSTPTSPSFVTQPENGNTEIIGPGNHALDDGTMLYLANGTTVERQEVNDADSIYLELKNGSIVVVAQTTAVIVSNAYGTEAKVSNGMLGVEFTAQPYRFAAACLLGANCSLEGELGGVVDLTTGQSSEVGGNGQPSESVAADYAVYYAFASAVVPAPTATHTPTHTPTPTETPTNTPTRWPTATPIPPTETPTPVTPTAEPDPGGGGGGNNGGNNDPQPPQPTDTSEPPPLPGT